MLRRAFAFLLLPATLMAAGEHDSFDLASLREIRLMDREGCELGLADGLVDGSLLVVAYTGVACPVAGKYAPRLTRMSAELAERGVRFVGVNASPQDTLGAIAREREELELGFPVLKDHRQALTRRLGVETTTEVLLFDAEGALRYRGAVDDQYVPGAAKPAPTKRWLADALEAVLAGGDVAEASTPAPGCRITLLGEDELPEVVTWARHVAPIVQRRCESCHRPGQAGPFSLQTYEEVRGWAEMIELVVEEGRMPPWNADERYAGVFANERRLGKREKQRLLGWIRDGMPRGDRTEEPAPAEWPTGWSIGEPDVVFAAETEYAGRDRPGEPLPEKGFAVPREGVVEYRYFAVQTDYPEDRWIRAIETRPGAPDVVHHVLVLLDDPNAEATSRQLDFRSYLAASVPGEALSVYPEGYGKRLPRGSTLVFQMHYTPNGKQRYDRPSVGMVFWDEPPLFEVVTDAVVDLEFRIPPGARDFEVRAEKLLMEDTGVIALLPHMHTRGQDFRYVAHYPDGSSEELLSSDFDFNWQESYLFHDPLPLPPGTRLECIGHFDNSPENPNNPDPEAWVEWGDQSFEEMFIGYYDYVRPLE